MTHSDASGALTLSPSTAISSVKSRLSVQLATSADTNSGPHTVRSYDTDADCVLAPTNGDRTTWPPMLICQMEDDSAVTTTSWHVEDGFSAELMSTSPYEGSGVGAQSPSTPCASATATPTWATVSIQHHRTLLLIYLSLLIAHLNIEHVAKYRISYRILKEYLIEYLIKYLIKRMGKKYLIEYLIKRISYRISY